MDNKKMGDFIAALRKAKNMTQKELAEKLNITDKAVSKWERGLGYPDITIVSSLGDILGVTVNELLNGERSEKGIAVYNINSIVENTLDYADKAVEEQRFKSSNIVIFAISLLFLISIFVCILCDFIISKTISWSIIPTCSVIFAWFIIVPIIKFEKNKWIISLASLNLFIMPFLWILERNSNIQGWFAPTGIPIAITSLIYLWGVVYLCCYTKINKWYIASIVVMFIPAVDIVVDIILKQFLIGYSMLINILGAAIVSFVLFYMGFSSKNGIQPR